MTLNRSLIMPFLEYARIAAPCAKPRGGHGPRGAMARARGFATDNRPSRLKSCACAMNVRSFWAMPISPATSGPEMAGSTANVERCCRVWTLAKARADQDAQRFTDMLHGTASTARWNPGTGAIMPKRRRKDRARSG